MSTELFPQPSQSGFDFPQTLAEKYKPSELEQFVGLDKVKRFAANLIAQPKALNLIFCGASGTGKTSMAFCIANGVLGEVHHIASKECDLDTVRNVVRQCHFAPRMFDTWQPAKFHVVIADEADQMSDAAQQAFLSILDGTTRPPNTIFIFTCNSMDRLQDRFQSRCIKFEFSSYGMAAGVVALLERVWDAETDNPAERPNFARIVKESVNNVRESLMRLETAIMSQ